MTVLIARLDNRARIRLFPTGSYSARTALGSLYACICLLSIGVTTEIYIPYFLQLIHGKSPLVAGYWTALMSAGWTLGSFISSSRSTGPATRLLVIGPIVSAASLALLALFLPLAHRKTPRPNSRHSCPPPPPSSPS